MSLSHLPPARVAAHCALAVLTLCGTAPAPALAGVDDHLVLPLHVAGADLEAANPALLAARRYATFWHTGEPRYAEAALAPDFLDRTLPPGRTQGRQGPLQASLAFRAAVPDLSAELEDVVIAGDRVSVRLRFHGHFTGHFGTAAGAGQAIDFQAFDLYRIAEGRIAENWHLEDNLGLMQQMGLAARQ